MKTHFCRAIAGLACSGTFAAVLSSCAPVASTYEFGYSTTTGAQPVSGVPYFLPRARILMVGTGDGAQYKIAMSRSIHADRSRRLFASFQGSTARSDDLSIGVKDGLLDSIVVKSKDETAAIAGAATDLALNAAKLSTFQLKSDSILGDSDAPQPFSVTFDPFVPSEIEAAKAIVLLKGKKHLCVKVTPSVQRGKATAQPVDHVGAVVVRAPAIVEIQLRRLEGDRELTVEMAAQIGRTAAVAVSKLAKTGARIDPVKVPFEEVDSEVTILDAATDDLAKRAAIEAGASTGRTVRPLAVKADRERRGKETADTEEGVPPTSDANATQKPDPISGDYTLLPSQLGAARRKGAALGAKAAQHAMTKRANELRLVKRGANALEDSQTFLVPDVSPAAEYRLKIPAGTFTERTTTYTFSMGELTKIDYKKPSETLGAIAVPAAVVKKLVGASE